MKIQLALAAGFVGLLAARSVFPCGAPFGTGISANPQQDIIVAYKNGVETYVFQPTFCGTASSFGLILPVPSNLTALPALSDQQAFTTVDSLSRPTYVTTTSCYPSNGSGGMAGGVPPGVDASATVVSSGRVGFLDWVQLKADTEQSFTDWLTTNGYPYSASASDVFAYYVQKGWYFVAFRISQGVVPDGGSIRGDGGSGVYCNALGPVKLSFTSTVPVVPSRMATAGTVSTGYSYSFSWRIFGLTTGDQQLDFTDGANGNRVLGYSGALAAADVSTLAGLATAGDRLTKLTLTFAYGSTDPDVGLSLAAASDYRQIIHNTQYVYCADAGTDAVVDLISGGSRDVATSTDLQPRPTPDANFSSDVEPAADARVSPVLGFDAQPAPVPDAGLSADAGAQVVADARTSPDTAPAAAPDAGTKPDALPAVASVDAGGNFDAAGTPGLSVRGSGCSVAGGSTSAGCFALTLLGLAIAGRVRKRRVH
jgi:MYXO-CTERM domain-containing protein